MSRPEWINDPSCTLMDYLVHEAAHAVMAWELGIEIDVLRVNLDSWNGMMTFFGAMYHFEGDTGSDAAREAAEIDMLIFHAGRVAQREFNYDGSHAYIPTIDLKGVMHTCQQVESDLDLIDAWSTYMEERARVMVRRPATWRSILALAAEIEFTPRMVGADIASFLRRLRFDEVPPVRRFPDVPRVEVAAAASEPTAPKDLRLVTEVLDLSARARSCLKRGKIETMDALLSETAWRLRGIRALGEKTLTEILWELGRHGLRLRES
jgi:hypothetical protein